MQTSDGRFAVIRLRAIALLGLAFVPVVAKADATYTYTGNQFNQWFNGTTCPAVCSISGSFTLSTPFIPFSEAIHGIDPGPPYDFGPFTTPVVPLAYSFTDGVHTLTQSNSTILLNIGAFSSAPLWFIDIQGGGVELFTGFNGSGAEATDSVVVNGNLQALLSVASNSPPPTTTTCTPNNPCSGDPGTWTVTATPEPPSSAMLLWAGMLALPAIVFRRFVPGRTIFRPTKLSV